jgi:hypothetical protein
MLPILRRFGITALVASHAPIAELPRIGIVNIQMHRGIWTRRRAGIEADHLFFILARAARQSGVPLWRPCRRPD